MSVARRSGPNRWWLGLWTASAPAQWYMPTKRAGGRMATTATSGLSALPPSGTSCVVVGARRWWMKSWARGLLACWSATSTPPTTTTTVPNNAAGPICCETSTTCAPSTPMMRHWPGGPTPSTGFTTGPKPALIPRPSGGAPPKWPWNARSPLPALPRRVGTQAKLCRRIERIKELFGGGTRSAGGQQRRRAQPAPLGGQPQDQRRHPLRWHPSSALGAPKD